MRVIPGQKHLRGVGVHHRELSHPGSFVHELIPQLILLWLLRRWRHIFILLQQRTNVLWLERSIHSTQEFIF